MQIYIKYESFASMLLLPTVGGMARKGCGRFPIKVQQMLKRATNLRIPLKPLMTIPRVSGSLLFLSYICALYFGSKSTIHSIPYLSLNMPK